MGPHDDAAHRIKQAAQRRITRHGPEGLDLTAVAGDAGVTRQGLDDLFPQRDSLLTALILDAYNEMGSVAEKADREAVAAARTPLQRWVATCRSVRIWAQAHPERYTLIWGPPLPAYSAPPETMIAGARTALVLTGIVRHSVRPVGDDTVFTGGMADNVQTLANGMLAGLRHDVIARLLVAWTQLLGAVSFAVWGHVQGFASDPDAFFEYATESMGRYVGLEH